MMIFIDFRLDWQSISIAKIWIDWIGLDWQPCLEHSIEHARENCEVKDTNSQGILTLN